MDELLACVSVNLCQETGYLYYVILSPVNKTEQHSTNDSKNNLIGVKFHRYKTQTLPATIAITKNIEFFP